MGGVRGRCIMAKKVPGGLWMALLFAPWTVYWVLCGLGRASGVLIGLILPPETYDAFRERGTSEYRAKKRAFAEELVDKASRLVPGLKEHIVVMDAATPRTFERYTLNPHGAIYGLDQSVGAPERPYFKTPIKGLYLVGASTFPGGGIEAVVISGIIAANDISDWPSMRKAR